jgi:type IV pilus assembly protein PilM
MAQLIVGLDIGTSAVRAAELDVGPSQPVLHTYGQVGLPPGAVVDGEVRDGGAVSEALRRLWGNGQFSSKRVVVGIAGLRAITREIDIPHVPDNEVEMAVRYQSEEVIPFPPDQTILSSQVLSDYTDAEGQQMRRVLVAAAHSDLVGSVIGAVESAGLTVDQVDLDSSALVRAVSAQSVAGQTEAIVSIGAGLTIIVIHQDGRPQFVRTVGTGGNATTAAISSALDMPLSDAEILKRRLGEGTPQVQSALRPAEASINEVVGEIRNSLQYFASLPGRSPVARVLMTGGGSYLFGLLPALESQVRIPVQMVSPLSRLDMSKVPLSSEQAAQVAGVLTTPIGLALPETNPAVKKFNLLPPEVAKRARIGRIQQRTIAAAAAVVVLLALYGGYQMFRAHQAQNDVNALNGQISTLQSEIPRYSVVTAANDAYNQGVQRRTTVLKAAVDWPLAFTGMVNATPGGATPIAVTSFDGSTNATTAASTPSSATQGPQAASIGTVKLNLMGPGPGLASPRAWTIAMSIPGGLFGNPVIPSSTTNTNGSVSFPSTVSILPKASLLNNKGLQ